MTQLEMAAAPRAVDRPLAMADAAEGVRAHILTIALEDYFHVGAFRGVIRREHWDRFEARLVANTRKTLNLLERFDVRATFFVLGWVAEHYPEIVREVAERGHELAASGYYHRGIRELNREEFRADAIRAREAVERASGQRVLGYRLPDQWLGENDLWALDELADAGFAYDSSLGPWFRSFKSEPWRRFVHRHGVQGRSLWELPPATWQIWGQRWPIAGGNYFRQLPHTLLKRGVAHWDRTFDWPLVLYFHVWELDPDQPRISAGSPWMRLRHYRNLHKMSWVWEDYLSKYAFVPAANWLGLPRATVENCRETTASRALTESVRSVAVASHGGAPMAAASTALPAGGSAAVAASADGTRLPVTIVVPCFNEENTLSYLCNTLERLEEAFGREYDLRMVLVDDGSRDGTWSGLERIFADQPRVKLVHHEKNRGIAAAILSGIRAAETEIVCSIDCDCSYDPHELRHMIPRLAPEVSLVTASPYHPRGLVRNVPRWRLTLSQGASWLYRRLLRHKLHTYTSCFRVYRRSAIVDLPLVEEGFLGICELVWKLDERPGAVVEHPATLEVRLFGHSKMKTLRTIRGHLRLMARMAAARLASGRHRDAAATPAGARHDAMATCASRHPDSQASRVPS